jgi:hypothetical protein
LVFESLVQNEKINKRDVVYLVLGKGGVGVVIVVICLKAKERERIEKK